jgi:hypothetical protein
LFSLPIIQAPNAPAHQVTFKTSRFVNWSVVRGGAVAYCILTAT